MKGLNVGLSDRVTVLNADSCEEFDRESAGFKKAKFKTFSTQQFSDQTRERNFLTEHTAKSKDKRNMSG